MPDIDRTADIKVIAGQGAVNAEIPLAGHASEHWLQIFHSLVSKRSKTFARRPRIARIVLGSSSCCLAPFRATIQSRRWMRHVS
jgi:hypothetical protein